MIKSKCLTPESGIPLLPTLATKIGVNEAIVLQQIHYWLNISTHKKHGKKWVFNSFSKWQKDNFPYWSVSTLKRIFASLKKQKMIETSNFNFSKFNRTNWYTINYENVPDCTFY